MTSESADHQSHHELLHAWEEAVSSHDTYAAHSIYQQLLESSTDLPALQEQLRHQMDLYVDALPAADLENLREETGETPEILKKKFGELVTHILEKPEAERKQILEKKREAFILYCLQFSKLPEVQLAAPDLREVKEALTFLKSCGLERIQEHNVTDLIQMLQMLYILLSPEARNFPWTPEEKEFLRTEAQLSEDEMNQLEKEYLAKFNQLFKRTLEGN